MQIAPWQGAMLQYLNCANACAVHFAGAEHESQAAIASSDARASASAVASLGADGAYETSIHWQVALASAVPCK